MGCWSSAVGVCGKLGVESCCCVRFRGLGLGFIRVSHVRFRVFGLEFGVD